MAPNSFSVFVKLKGNILWLLSNLGLQCFGDSKKEKTHSLSGEAPALPKNTQDCGRKGKNPCQILNKSEKTAHLFTFRAWERHLWWRIEVIFYPPSAWTSDDTSLLNLFFPQCVCSDRWFPEAPQISGNLQPFHPSLKSLAQGKLRLTIQTQAVDFFPRIPVSSLRLPMGTLGMVPIPVPWAEVSSIQDMQREVVPRQHPKWTLLENVMKFMTNCRHHTWEEMAPALTTHGRLSVPPSLLNISVLKSNIAILQVLLP